MGKTDYPSVTICRNASQPHLVHFSVGTGQGGYNVTPAFAEEMAAALVDAAAEARGGDRIG